ncbi:hypothetical protein EJ08DRAFT_653538 [Tothia fuscella]|uniref:Uncharacterized protein n=1 Tax=Tothia fuscella TaxID=1048955 RepID=A0A9P4TTW4_9PEZI|nr:hypothetical protein EJ08DRAFT_653538 [Tothia fuscella]
MAIWLIENHAPFACCGHWFLMKICQKYPAEPRPHDYGCYEIVHRVLDRWVMLVVFSSCSITVCWCVLACRPGAAPISKEVRNRR